MTSPSSSPCDRCARCRYDLRGAAPERGHCPECGQALTPAALDAVRERRFLWRLTRVLLALGAGGLLAAAGASMLLPEQALSLVPLFGLIVALGAVPVLAAAYGEHALADR